MRKRGQRGQGSARLDNAEIRKMLQKVMPMATALGVVRKFPGETSHFEIQIDEDGTREVMVDVELIPRSERVFCRLGFGGDQILRIPRVNQEVAVLIPGSKNSLVADELDFDPVIVAVLDNDVPAELDDDDIVIINAPRVHIVCDDIKLGTDPDPLDGVVVGSGIDPFTGSTYAALGNSSAKVKAEK